MNTVRTAIAVVVALLAGCGFGWTIADWLASPEPSAEFEGLRQQLAAMDLRLIEQGQKIDELQRGNEQLTETLTSEGVSAGDQRAASIQDALRAQRDELAAVQRQLQATQADRFGALLRGGTMLRELGLLDAALIELCKAIAMAPDNYGGYVNRGMTYQDLGQWEDALADFEMAARLNPDNIVPWNNLAWLKATCPDVRFRNGTEALEHAAKACEMTEWRNFATLSTLAAAYAESGDFPTAIRWQEESLKSAPPVVRPQLEESLALYKAEQPLREAAKRPPADDTDSLESTLQLE